MANLEMVQTPAPGTQPDFNYPPYRSSVARSPRKPLLVVPQALVNCEGPAFGHSIVGPHDNDLTAQHSADPIGERIITYSLAWGINHGLLDKAKFEPVVSRAWAGMVAHIYADGRLGSIQPIDGAPGKFKPSASYVYGVGGFLLAASELDVLAQSEAAKQPKQGANLHMQ